MYITKKNPHSTRTNTHVHTIILLKIFIQSSANTATGSLFMDKIGTNIRDKIISWYLYSIEYWNPTNNNEWITKFCEYDTIQNKMYPYSLLLLFICFVYKQFDQCFGWYCEKYLAFTKTCIFGIAGELPNTSLLVL